VEGDANHLRYGMPSSTGNYTQMLRQLPLETGQNGSGQNGSGQNGIWTKWCGQYRMDKMVPTFCIDFNSIEFNLY